MKFIKFICFFVCCLLSTPSFSDELNLSIDKKVISEGDVLYLTISYDGDSHEKPDFSHILEDFVVTHNSTSRQYSMINGVVTQTKKWTIGLKPLKTGKITIKPVKLDGLTSNYEEVEVKELSNVAYVPDSNENINSPYFQIEQKLENNSLYLNQQGVLWVTIYDSIGLNNGSLNIDEKSKEDWLILPILEKPIINQETINNKKMNVINFAFAVFPQKSGDILLPLFSFEGDYVKNVDFGLANLSNQFGLFGGGIQSMFGETVPVRMKTKEKTIKIKPAINNVNIQQWFPVKSVNVSSSVSQTNGFMVGDAFSYEIKVRAVGVTQSLFPLINIKAVEGLKQYQEKPEFVEEVVGKDIVTTATYNVVYIPEKSGELSIPSVDVYWFNVNKDLVEISSLKEQKIKVKPRDGKYDNNVTEPIVPLKKEAEKQEASDNDTVITNNYFDFVLSFAEKYLKEIIGVFAFILLWLLYRKKNKKTANIYTKQVIKALRARDYKQAKSCLIEWAKIKFKKNDINNFRDIVLYARNYEFEKQLDILNKILYSDSEEALNVKYFIKIFEAIDKQKIKKKGEHDVLPNLYK